MFFKNGHEGLLFSKRKMYGLRGFFFTQKGVML